MNINLYTLTKKLLEDKMKIVGVVGQAGAGKTTICKKLETLFGSDISIVGFDCFFNRTRAQRKQWIEDEERNHPQQWIARDQINWWNFEKAHRVLAEAKNGRTITLTNVYNRQDNGEFSGTTVIDGSKLIVVEGVPLFLIDRLIDYYIYIHVEPAIRQRRILGRDISARKKKAAEKRWLLTQTFETREYHPTNLRLVKQFIDNSIDHCSDSPDVPNVLPLCSEQDVIKSLKEQKEELSLLQL